MCANAIVALGRIAIGLTVVNSGVADSVLQIYQQRFCNPPSALDTLIVSQLADMLIADVVGIISEGRFEEGTRCRVRSTATLWTCSSRSRSTALRLRILQPTTCRSTITGILLY